MDAQIKHDFKARVREWATKLDVAIVWLGVRPMRNKWASCSSNGHLNFSDELLEFDRDLWDYVIVHELLHFSVPNHGKLWKSLMRAHLGPWELAEARLRENGLSSPRTVRRRREVALPASLTPARSEDRFSRLQDDYA
jgi:predicted metal-dependent hydrolase